MNGARIVGLAHAKKMLNQVEPVLHEHLGWAADVTRQQIARTAASRVPVRYGNLKRFIGSTFSKATGKGRVGIRGGTAVVPASFEGIGPGGKVVAPARYAHLVHWGWAGHTGVPFMTMAAEGERESHLQRVKAAGLKAKRQLEQEGPMGLSGGALRTLGFGGGDFESLGAMGGGLI